MGKISTYHSKDGCLCDPVLPVDADLHVVAIPTEWQCGQDGVWPGDGNILGPDEDPVPFEHGHDVLLSRPVVLEQQVGLHQVS